MNTAPNITIKNNPSDYINPQEWEMIMHMGEVLVKTKFLGASITSGAQAAAIILRGRELRIPPMQSLSSINIIQNKPTISPELMLALIYRDIPGVKINFAILTKEHCQIKTTRPGQVEQTIEFTKQDAVAAGLWNGNTWKKYSRAMLRSRAIGEMARTVYPDVIAGCSYTPEELGADVDGEGNVIDVQPPTPIEQKTTDTAQLAEPKPAHTASKPAEKKDMLYDPNNKGHEKRLLELLLQRDDVGQSPELWDDIGKSLAGLSPRLKLEEVIANVLEKSIQTV